MTIQANTDQFDLFGQPPLRARETSTRGETPAGPRAWVAVASAEHVRRGQSEGFIQVCHGKAAPLRRMRPGDRVVTYSPTGTFGGTDKLQAFTAIGLIKSGDPFPFDMGGGFRPFRREVDWLAGAETPIRPLLGRLAFTAGNSHWGYQLRFGLFEIPLRDIERIALAMHANWPAMSTHADAT